MRHLLLAAALFLAAPVAMAQEADDLVRLPGDGAVKKLSGQRNVPDRLVPGGGLILTFDTDGNRRIDRAEIEAGARAAFVLADANKDASLTALEQIDWAAGLPSHDDSLANPVRFDPNLDRSVSQAEFVSVILMLADAYTDTSSGAIPIANLEAPKRDEDEGRFGPFGGRAPEPRRAPESLTVWR